MGHETWTSKYVICPYYKADTPFSIVCEGLYRNATVTQNFGERAAKKAHFVQNCCDMNYNLCYIAEMLNNKITEEERTNERG